MGFLFLLFLDRSSKTLELWSAIQIRTVEINWTCALTPGARFRLDNCIRTLIVSKGPINQGVNMARSD